MTDRDEAVSGRPHMVVLLALLAFLGTGLLTAYNGLIDGEVTLKRYPRNSGRDTSHYLPPEKIWRFTGPDAVRVGIAGFLVAASGALLIAVFFLTRRRPWGSRQRRLTIASLALLSVAAVLGFAPWQFARPGPIAAFYGFLLPALIGACVSPWKGWILLPAGLAGGVALSAVLGGKEWLDGFVPGLLAFILLGGHVAIAWGDRVRRVFPRRIP